MTPDTIISLPGIGTISLLELERSVYAHNPVKWVKDKLDGFLWSKQREILTSIVTNRRTAVQSCYGAGKSYVAGLAACWWIDSHKPGTARVVTSAPTGDQVKIILWNEIGRAHSQGKLPGRLNQTEWWLNVGDREELVGVGRKPKDYSPSAFQGIHERYVLVILDEAAGIPKSLWEAVDGLLSNEDCRLLSIGNPEDATSEFANECKPGSGANTIQISAFDTPNLTGEDCPDEVKARLVSRIWIEEKKKKWGEENPLYIAKVKGEFPQSSKDSLIPISWVRAAQERNLLPEGKNELGVDVGGGNAANTIYNRKGPVVRRVHKDFNPDTMQTLSATLQCIESTGADIAKVDYIGIGHGAVDRAKEMANDHQIKRETPQRAINAGKIVGVEVGKPAKDSEHYVNLRAEGYWLLRERFRPDNLPHESIDIDQDDEDLAAQLCAIKYKPSAGRMQIESKMDMKARRIASPDDADAVMLSFLEVETEGEEWYTW